MYCITKSYCKQTSSSIAGESSYRYNEVLTVIYWNRPDLNNNRSIGPNSVASKIDERVPISMTKQHRRECNALSFQTVGVST